MLVTHLSKASSKHARNTLWPVLLTVESEAPKLPLIFTEDVFLLPVTEAFYIDDSHFRPVILPC